MTETQHKILDTAERLFGDQGYAGTSLRQIIAAAGVNLAAVHYHFGSKEELLEHLVARKAAPINAERLALLDRFEAEFQPAAVPLEMLLEAFLEPPMARIKENPDFAKLMGRLYGEGLMPTIAERHFQTVVARFTTAFGKTLPQLSQEELALRLRFMIGAMAHTMMFCSRSQLFADSNTLMRQLVSFIVGGLQAPPSITKESK
jgi:AcrR family transcriptional regulator